MLGAEELEGVDWLPPLIDGDHFDAALVRRSGSARESASSCGRSEFPDADDLRRRRLQRAGDRDAATRRLLDEGEVEAVLQFPPGIRRPAARSAAGSWSSANARPTPTCCPKPIILYNSADEKSQLAQLRVEQVLRRWRNAVTEKNLAPATCRSRRRGRLKLQPRDVALERQRQAAVWSKVLPFIVFIWALTGAFYPAVDLCAGEKERGTLETLLTSPALRREIVWGKLLTVMTFSIADGAAQSVAAWASPASSSSTS